MKILFYSPVQLQEGGGCERWHCDVANSLKKQFGDEVEIVTGNLGSKNWDDDYLEKQLGGISYTKINFPIIAGILIPTPKTFLKLYQKFKKVDVVHFIHGFAGQDVLVLLLKLLTGKKIIAGHHAPIFHQNKFHNFQMKFFGRFFLNFFDGHMTLNAGEKKFLEEKWKIKNVHFIPSGIRVERFLKIKRKLNDKLNFLTVGIYRPQKGFDLLVCAVDKFNKQFPKNKAVFRTVGGGEQKKIISRYAKRNKNLIDVGYVKYEDMPKIYEKSDIYLSTSREEPFGLVFVESWCSGIPVLATKTEGSKDMLIDGKNGWLIDEMSVEGIYRAIVTIYERWRNSPEVLKKMEKKCRETGKLFSIDMTAVRMRKELLA